MIATIDLIPPGLHQRRCRWVRLRAYGTLLVLLVVGIGLAGLQTSRRARQVNELNQVAAQLRSAQARLDHQGVAVSAELAGTQRLLREAERLRNGHRWSRLLAYLAAQVPDSVLLVMVSTDPAEPGKRGSRTRAGSQVRSVEGRQNDSPQALAIRGYALGHGDLAAFLRKLQEGDIFDSVSLLHSKREPFLEGEGLAFTLTCHW